MSEAQVTKILQAITFGHRIAEDEIDELASYFVETDQWRRIFAGEIDVVYGPKGSGKSAIYFLLLNNKEALAERGISIVAAENPRGAPAFKDLVEDPPTSESEFRGLWKLYILALVGDQLRQANPTSAEAHELIDALREAGLLEEDGLSLSRLIKAALNYVRRLLSPESVEGTVHLDPNTGLPIGLTGRITLSEPTAEQRNAGVRSADELFQKADTACQQAGVSVWVALDRLDVAFAETPELEQNALRALFRVYIDLVGLKTISLKIFLRDDIWKRISDEGFREASHITQTGRSEPTESDRAACAQTRTD